MDKQAVRKSVVVTIGETLGTLSAVALIASVLHDHFFMMALGSDISALPSTLSDHFRNAINWLPFTAGSLILGGALGILAAESEDEKDRDAHGEGMIAIAWFGLILFIGQELKKRPLIISFSAMFVGYISLILFGLRGAEIFLILIGVPLIFATLIMISPALAGAPSIVRYTLFLILMLFMFSSLNGFKGGLALTEEPSASAQILTATSHGFEEHVVAFNLEAGLLTLPKGKSELHFIPKGEIRSVRHNLSPRTIKGIVPSLLDEHFEEQPTQPAKPLNKVQ